MTLATHISSRARIVSIKAPPISSDCPLCGCLAASLFRLVRAKVSESLPKCKEDIEHSHKGTPRSVSRCLLSSAAALTHKGACSAPHCISIRIQTNLKTLIKILI